MESSNVVVDDSAEERSTDVADDAIASDIQFDEPDIVEEVENSIESSKPDPTSIDPTNDPPKKGPSIRVQKNHPQELIIGDPGQGITTRRMNDVVQFEKLQSKLGVCLFEET